MLRKYWIHVVMVGALALVGAWGEPLAGPAESGGDDIEGSGSTVGDSSEDDASSTCDPNAGVGNDCDCTDHDIPGGERNDCFLDQDNDAHDLAQCTADNTSLGGTVGGTPGNTHVDFGPIPGESISSTGLCGLLEGGTELFSILIWNDDGGQVATLRKISQTPTTGLLTIDLNGWELNVSTTSALGSTTALNNSIKTKLDTRYSVTDAGDYWIIHYRYGNDPFYGIRQIGIRSTDTAIHDFYVGLEDAFSVGDCASSASSV